MRLSAAVAHRPRRDGRSAVNGGVARPGTAAEPCRAQAEGQAGSVWRPDFPVDVPTPDIGPWIAGNTGLPGFTTLDGAADGPHVMLVALTHGNETAGAAALDRLLRAGTRPARGRLTLGFANLDAFQRFDRAQPTATRFLDEDLNRLWAHATLDGPRSSRELERARAMRPLLERADLLLDLHSMLWPSDPLILSGPAAKGRNLASAIGVPALVVADTGHLGGRRLIDFAPFADPASPRAAVLVEAGQHWQPGTVDTTLACIDGLLRQAGMRPGGATRPGGGAVRCAEVTMTVTAMTTDFAFVRPFRGGEVIAAGDTLIATDGTTEVRTPHDDCLLVMPSLRPSRGHTAVRLARFT